MGHQNAAVCMHIWQGRLQLAVRQSSLDLFGLIQGPQPCFAAEVSSSAWARPTCSECRHSWLERSASQPAGEEQGPP